MKSAVIFITCRERLIACKDFLRRWIPDTCPRWSGVIGDNIKLNQFDDMLSFFNEKYTKYLIFCCKKTIN